MTVKDGACLFLRSHPQGKEVTVGSRSQWGWEQTLPLPPP